MHSPLRQGKQMPASNRLMSLRPAHPCRGSWKNEGFFFFFHSRLEMKTRILDLNLYLECAFRRGGCRGSSEALTTLVLYRVVTQMFGLTRQKEWALKVERKVCSQQGFCAVMSEFLMLKFWHSCEAGIIRTTEEGYWICRWRSCWRCWLWETIG